MHTTQLSADKVLKLQDQSHGLHARSKSMYRFPVDFANTHPNIEEQLPFMQHFSHAESVEELLFLSLLPPLTCPLAIANHCSKDLCRFTQAKKGISDFVAVISNILDKKKKVRASRKAPIQGQEWFLTALTLSVGDGHKQRFGSDLTFLT